VNISKTANSTKTIFGTNIQHNELNKKLLLTKVAKTLNNGAIEHQSWYIIPVEQLESYRHGGARQLAGQRRSDPARLARGGEAKQ
jgi:hypothetical protein